MAFGKDPKLAALGGSFRQSTNTFTQNRGGGKSTKGNVPYFVDMYQPSQLTIDTVRLVPGAYLQEQIVGEGDEAQVAQVTMPFIKFTEHFYDTKHKGSICSAGAFANVKAKRGPCRGCDIFWETAAKNPTTNRFESNVISRQNKFAFSLLDYGPYHKLEQYDKEKGTVRTNSKGEPYYNWVKCQGQGCDACHAGKEVKSGDMRHWPMSYTQFQQLRAAELLIGAACARCATVEVNNMAAIQSVAWSCPECGSRAIDMATTQLKLNEMLKVTDNPYTCGDCKAEVLLTEEYRCLECSKRGQQGLRAGLFDVDLRVQATPIEGKKGKDLQIRGWSPPRAVDPNYIEIVKPVDLVARYAPDSMEVQVSKFGAAVQRAPVTSGVPPQQQHAQPYGPKSA
jgi:DNA-directed RNA polymerase subunit RPC12/RpoP